MVVTRYAPSPTGDTHIGGVRTALYAYALAKKHGGKFILRLEDTDQKREVPGSAEQIKEILHYFGMDYDELYKQSERLFIYQEYAKKLVEKGAAYYCFASKEEIDAARKLAEENGENYKFRSPYRDIPLAEAEKRLAKGEKYVIRQRLPENTEIEFNDELQGKMKFNTNDMDETVLLKSDGFPTYHLAVVVDDELMGVTHVFRGVEWLSSAPKHKLLYQAFNFKMPKFYHLSLILDPEGGKLSKRKGAVAAKEFIKQGYIKEAILNFLMLLGWSAPIVREHGEKEQEVFSLHDFVEMFDPGDLNKASPVFNREKLLWFNQKYFQVLSLDHLQNTFVNWLSAYGSDPDLAKAIVARGPDYLQKILEQERTRAKLLSELPERIRFFYYPGEKQDIKSFKRTKTLTDKEISIIFGGFIQAISGQPEDFSGFTHEDWEAAVRSLADKHAVKAGTVFMALRIAITASEFSPPLFEVMQILGKKEVEQRLQKYIGN